MIKHDICLAAKQIIWNQPKCSWMCQNAFCLWRLDLLKVEEAMWTVLRKHSFPNFKQSLNFLPLWSFEDESSLIFRGKWDQSKNLYNGKVWIIKVWLCCVVVMVAGVSLCIMIRWLLQSRTKFLGHLYLCGPLKMCKTRICTRFKVHVTHPTPTYAQFFLTFNTALGGENF